MELPIKLAGQPLENSRDVRSPALWGGRPLAYQGFVAFLPGDGKVLQIDWDGSDLPKFAGIQKAFMGELNKSEALRDMVSTAAVGCLLPDIKHGNEDINVNAPRGNSVN